ncbi:AI-2E family transporter [Halolamina litorea]|uniref:AI-2E family transporter n=1 Tax=Halolamina litorea TaxID=1515593 RepID=A0ABD6BPN5_9EURY|nr:AI-2E family transporter [Halolamina litorea]
MSDDPTIPGPRPGLTALALASAVIGLLVILPYLQYVLFGVVFAYMLYPVQKRVEEHVEPTTGAIAVVAGTVVVVLAPLVYVVTVATRQLIDIVRVFRAGEFDLRAIESILETNGYEVDLVRLFEANQDRIVDGLRQLLTGAFDLAGTVPSLFIGITVSLFVLFALLRDGESLMAWGRWVVPVGDDVLDDLVEGVDELMWASVVGNVAVAAIQSVMLGVGLFVAGVPAIVFLTVMAFVLTLLPLVGLFMVWVPASGYLIVVGRPTAAAAVAVYGLLIMFSDSYLRPATIGHTKAYNSATVIVGIFGGLVLFGAVGLFIGPVVLGAAKLALDCFARERSHPEGAT